MDANIFAEVDQYISNLLAEEDPALIAAQQSIEAAGLTQMSISANQGKFLQVLARACNAKKILELGTFAGYSTIWLAKALPKNGKLISIEFNPFHAEIARKNIKNAGLDEVVDIRIGRALEILAQIESEQIAPFDMIFIDADKPPYLEYFNWAVSLARQGTVIVCDNVVREGKVLDNSSTDEAVIGVQQLNKFLATDARVTATIIQSIGIKDHDGMVIAVVN